MRFNYERLRTLREAAGLSQYELARRAGVSTTYIQNLEKGKVRHPGEEYVDRLAALFSVPAAALYVGMNGASGSGGRETTAGPDESEREQLVRLASGRTRDRRERELLVAIMEQVLSLPPEGLLRAEDLMSLVVDKFGSRGGEGGGAPAVPVVPSVHRAATGRIIAPMDLKSWLDKPVPTSVVWAIILLGILAVLLLTPRSF